jgi:hypothetical protein
MLVYLSGDARSCSGQILSTYSLGIKKVTETNSPAPQAVCCLISIQQIQYLVQNVQRLTTTVVIIYWGIENLAKWLAQTARASKLGMERQTHELPRLSVGFVFYSKSISNVKSEILSLF